jgi:outer membrane receptor protein involved in Fe transport
MRASACCSRIPLRIGIRLDVDYNGATIGGNAIRVVPPGLPVDVRRLYTPGMPHYHTNEPSVYFQDDWRAKSWLTLNMGIRYDVFPAHRRDQSPSNFVPSEGNCW